MNLSQGPDADARRAEFESAAIPHMAALYRWALRLAPVAEDAEDLVQETFARAYRTFDNFERGTNCKAWLFTILYSVHVNRYHQARRLGTTVSLDDLEERFQRYVAAPDNTADAAEKVTAWGTALAPEVKEALDRLPPDFRAPVLLVDVGELSYEEAARVLECPVGTVRSRLFRARRLLFVLLQEFAAQSGYPGGTR